MLHEPCIIEGQWGVTEDFEWGGGMFSGISGKGEVVLSLRYWNPRLLLNFPEIIARTSWGGRTWINVSPTSYTFHHALVCFLVPQFIAFPIQKLEL